jgi:hypothetical protein
VFATTFYPILTFIWYQDYLYLNKSYTTMKKGVLFGIAAVAVGVVVFSLTKKTKPTLPYYRPYVR